MSHIPQTQIEKLKEAKTIKELKDALVKIFNALNVEMAVQEALNEKRVFSKGEASETSVRP